MDALVSLLTKQDEDKSWPFDFDEMEGFAEMNRAGAAEAAITCIRKGAKVTVRGPGGCTPLHLAAMYSEGPLLFDLAEALINAGADVNARDDLGRTPLMGALATWKKAELKGSRLRFMELLLEKGAAIEVLDQGGLEFPLGIAAKDDMWYSAFLVRFLLIHGAKKDFADVNGNNALYHAEDEWNDVTALFLKTAEADAEIFMQQGYNALGEKNFSNAVECFSKVLEIDPQNVAAAYNLGDAYISLEKWDKAERAFRKVRDEKKQFILDAKLYLGIALYRQGKIERAVKMFAGYDITALDCWAHGDTVIETGKSMAENLEVSDFTAVVYRLLGTLILRYREDAEAALGWFQRAASQNIYVRPGHRLFAARMIIQIGEKTGREKEVAEAWRIRKEVKSHIAANLIVRGDEHFAQGDYWEALNAYERAVNEGGPNGYASYRAAIAHRKMRPEDFYAMMNDYYQALEAGLFGVELDASYGHQSEADVRRDLEKLLEQHTRIEKVRAIAATARSYTEIAAAALAGLEERLEKEAPMRAVLAFKISAATEKLEAVNEAAEAAENCVTQAEHLAAPAALGNSFAAGDMNACLTEAATWAEAAKRAASLAVDISRE